MARYAHSAGSILDHAQACNTLTLKAAEFELWRLAAGYEIARAAGSDRLAGIYEREARSLSTAITQAVDWRRAAGWDRPHEADRKVS